MSYTLNELCDQLKELDELSILEMLNIDSTILVERLKDDIEDKFDFLVGQFDENDYSESMGWEENAN